MPKDTQRSHAGRGTVRAQRAHGTDAWLAPLPWTPSPHSSGHGTPCAGGMLAHSSGKNSRGRLPAEIGHMAWLRRWLKPAVVGDL